MDSTKAQSNQPETAPATTTKPSAPVEIEPSEPMPFLKKKRKSVEMMDLSHCENDQHSPYKDAS